MKISPASFDALRAAIEPLDTPEVRELYLTGQFPRADRVKDLDVRYRWDLYWAARRSFDVDLYAEGLVDSHIDTALRRIVPNLTEEVTA
jgi:hypothetical protein